MSQDLLWVVAPAESFGREVPAERPSGEELPLSQATPSPLSADRRSFGAVSTYP